MTPPGAPRLTDNAPTFKKQFRKLVTKYEDLDAIAEKADVSIATLRRWYEAGVSQPERAVIEKVAKYFSLPDWKAYFLSESDPQPSPNEPSSITASAPDWLHKALDEAYATRHSDIVLSVITMAAKEFTQMRSTAP